MISGAALASLATSFLPRYSGIEWGDIWDRSGAAEEGAAFEWTVLASLGAYAQTQGWECDLPILGLPSGQSLFRLRNEVPLHYGAQPGHAGRAHRGIALKDQFLQALLPKLVLSKGSDYYSVFREGCPYHQIMMGASYAERPDILFLHGQPTLGYPKLTANDSEVEFSFDLLDGPTISGSLRIKNSPRMPCRWRNPEERFVIPVGGIVECSVNKPALVALAQLTNYSSLFGRNDTPPAMVLVTGNPLETLRWPNALVDLDSSARIVEQQLRLAAKLALTTFGLL